MTASTQQLKQALQNSPMADAPEVRAAAAASLRVLYAVVLSIQSMEAGILSKRRRLDGAVDRQPSCRSTLFSLSAPSRLGCCREVCRLATRCAG